jgi:lipoyl(octanoyl) transferase
MKISSLGLKDYHETWRAMRTFTDTRTPETEDEIWLVQHPPVFTQGQSGKAEHILDPKNIPIVQSDRGGQVTYHGPGQLVAYLLIDVQRAKINIRQLVTHIETAVINMLAEYGISATARCDAPGVYVNQDKICSIGLRLRRGCSYHGLALNVDMDLKPFDYIHPCGFVDLKMTQMKDFVPGVRIEDVEEKLAKHLVQCIDKTGCKNAAGANC